jgi:hypothetical protein
LETREEHDRIQEAAEAERAATKAEELRSGKRKEAVGWAKPKEGEEIELDKARLKKAIEEEKKRKNLSEAELLERAKKSKSDVSQEEMGKLSASVHGSLADNLQRLIGCRNRLTTILWQITRTRRICDFLAQCSRICFVPSCIASCVLPSYASDSCPSLFMRDSHVDCMKMHMVHYFSEQMQEYRLTTLRPTACGLGLTKTPQEPKRTHSIPNQLTQPLSLLPLSVS